MSQQKLFSKAFFPGLVCCSLLLSSAHLILYQLYSQSAHSSCHRHVPSVRTVPYIIECVPGLRYQYDVGISLHIVCKDRLKLHDCN